MRSRRPAARAERDSDVDPALITRSRPPRVLIAGGGVAGLETLLALRALASDLPRHHDPRARAQVHQPVDERRSAVQAPAGPRPQAAGHRRRARRSLAPGGAGPRRARAQPRDHQGRRRGSVRHARARPRRPPRAGMALTGSADLPRRSRRPQLSAAAPPAPRGAGEQARVRQARRSELAAAPLRPRVAHRGRTAPRTTAQASSSA